MAWTIFCFRTGPLYSYVYQPAYSPSDELYYTTDVREADSGGVMSYHEISMTL